MNAKMVGQFIIRKKDVFLKVLVVVGLVAALGVYLANLSPYQYKFGDESVFYVRAKVISEPKTTPMKNTDTRGVQELSVKIQDGPDTDLYYTVKRSVFINDNRDVQIPVGSTVLLSKSKDQDNYNYMNRWHIPGLAFVLCVVALLVVFIGKWRGLTGVIGLLISISVLFMFVVPKILSGGDAYFVCVQGAFIIAIITILIAHGFNKRAFVALLSTLVILLLVVLGVSVASQLVGFVGYAGSETSGLHRPDGSIGVYGLIAGGMLIAVLGVLDDITTGQSAVIDELHKTNKGLGVWQLYTRGLSVGREHVASLVNTMVLVYVGVSLPTIILLQMYYEGPLLVLLNYEVITEEILRTLITSASLLIAVPVSTFMAAYILPRWRTKHLLKKSV